MSKITIYRGDDVNINLTITDEAGDPVDITGYEFFFTCKVNDTDAESAALIKKDVSTHTNPTQGLTTIILDNDLTAVTPGTYVYDIQMKDTSSKITTLIKGRFVITQDVTLRKS